MHDRILPQAVEAACKAQGIAYAAFSDNWILRLQRGGEQHWVYGYKFDINPIAASLIAQDKVATYLVLQAAGVPALRHVLVRSLLETPIDHAAVLAALPSGAAVLKPLTGTGGRGVVRYDTAEQALVAAEASSEPGLALSPLVQIASETRCLVLDGEVLLAYEKQAVNGAGDFAQHNMSRGAQIREIAPAEVPERLRAMALQTVQALGLRLAAVDIIRLQDGTEMVLEVNDGCSMEHYARLSPQHRDRAYAIYDQVVRALFATAKE